jgi:glycosyltransferase involved in cell wall biosynthesis
MSAPLRICFLSSGHPPLDKRVHYKEAVALARAGFDVTHVASGDVGGQTIDGVKFVCFKGRRSVRGRLAQLGMLYRLARTVDADVYHCNEMESWSVGVLLKLRRRARVIFDVHELYSTNVSERLFAPPLRPLVEWLVRLYFRALLPFTDRLVFAKRSAQKDFPAVPHKTVLVQNFSELGDFEGAARTADSARPLQPGKIVALHLGAINRGRGWPQLLEAMTRVQHPDLNVSVVGQFGDGTEGEFKDAVVELGLSERVSFTPWIPYEDVPAYTAGCQIGLITFQPVHQNFVHALPHKLFDYMAAGLPVVVPDFAVEVADIVNTSGCGLLIDTTKPDVIADALDRLAKDAELRRTMGDNGRRAVRERYNWENEARTLVAMYRAIEAAVHRERGSAAAIC